MRTTVMMMMMEVAAVVLAIVGMVGMVVMVVVVVLEMSMTTKTLISYGFSSCASSLAASLLQHDHHQWKNKSSYGSREPEGTCVALVPALPKTSMKE